MRIGSIFHPAMLFAFTDRAPLLDPFGRLGLVEFPSRWVGLAGPVRRASLGRLVAGHAIIAGDPVFGNPFGVLSAIFAS